MKRCARCGEDKPESEFSADKTKKDGLDCCCKQCKRLKYLGYTAPEVRAAIADEKIGWQKIGGWRINILKHTKERENRFNMIEIGGDKTLALSTNDKELFKRRICEIINSF